MLFGIPVDFILFALVLIGVALFHHHTLRVALTGLAVIVLYKLLFTGFKEGAGVVGLLLHMQHEWVVLSNLLCLLLGFALLADHFEQSQLPEVLPRFLPAGWVGGVTLLVLIAVLSSFLDNIAAALIGGSIAYIVFDGKVHIGYLAAIVAASNAGGSGSVVGDTTTTMMWIAGVNPLYVTHAYVAAIVALIVCSIPAAIQQHKLQPIDSSLAAGAHIDKARVAIVFFILVMAIAANVVANTVFVGLADRLPVIGIAVWTALLLAIPLRQPNWSLLPEASRGTLFLLSLVTCASLMPVEKLPPASWESAFALGFVSAVFDNIPLTALAIKQDGYDWGVLAYTVGFGGSMIWFGSSAGVAISSKFPIAKDAAAWLKNGWHVTLAYILGFAAMMAAVGWQPHAILAH
ncbi:MAG: citrate transporter [Magnetococcales bacterium]|nr:citrate transporter [Magnetococcales bacterium]MBF0115233.1 citrate transporter [Magnetococcales bacterium]